MLLPRGFKTWFSDSDVSLIIVDARGGCNGNTDYVKVLIFPDFVNRSPDFSPVTMFPDIM